MARCHIQSPICQVIDMWQLLAINDRSTLNGVEFALSGQLSILGVVRAQTFLFDPFLWPFLVFFTNPDVPHPGQIKKTPPAWAK